MTCLNDDENQFCPYDLYLLCDWLDVHVPPMSTGTAVKRLHFWNLATIYCKLCIYLCSLQRAMLKYIQSNYKARDLWLSVWISPIYFTLSRCLAGGPGTCTVEFGAIWTKLWKTKRTALDTAVKARLQARLNSVREIHKHLRQGISEPGKNCFTWHALLFSLLHTKNTIVSGNLTCLLLHHL